RGYGGFDNILIDSGYTSRYLGAYVALGMDWLHGDGGLSSFLKTNITKKLVRWSDYTKQSGYQHLDPESNYGAGEYWSRVLTALALVNRDPTDGPRLMNDALNYRQQYVVPTLTSTSSPSLNGGFWAEGWNYGQLAAEELILAGVAL